MAKLRYTVTGFMKDAAYFFHLFEFFKGYEDKFGTAETIDVQMDEIPYTMIGREQKTPITFSEDGKNINIYYSSWKYYDRKGKEKSKPSAQSVFSSLKNLMDRTVDEYVDKFTSK
jgi:hypothetical protein